MTVYFVAPVGDTTKVKIGVTSDLQTRLQSISAEFADGIELIAQCEGGVETERAFHSMLDAHRLEGEWFIRAPEVEVVISAFRQHVTGKRIWSRLRSVEKMDASPLGEDREIALGLMRQLMGKYGAIPFGVAQRRAFDDLAAINPMWTCRRVRAIWEKSAKRIDHYEIRDLTKALSIWNAGTRQVDASEAGAAMAARSPSERAVGRRNLS